MIQNIPWSLSAGQERRSAEQAQEQGLWSQAAIHWRQAHAKSTATYERDMFIKNAQRCEAKINDKPAVNKYCFG